MKIEFLSQNRVRVFLTPADMENFDIDFDLLDGFDDYTQNVIVKLVNEVKKESEFDISTGKLFVEVFPNAGKGCVFYLTLLPFEKSGAKPKAKKTPSDSFIYKFDSINCLVACCKGILKNYNRRIEKSSLYLIGKEYYLCTFPGNPNVKDMQKHLEEYGTYFGAGNLPNAYMSEYGKLLIRDTAIEKLCFFLS